MTTAFFARNDFRAQLVQELAKHHRTMREELDLIECKCGAWYRNVNEHLADALAPVAGALAAAQLADRLEASNPDRGAEFSEGVDWAVGELRALGAGR